MKYVWFVDIWQVTVDTDRTVVAFYKFLKKHASIPFKLQKPASTSKPESSDAKMDQETSTKDVKDELWGFYVLLLIYVFYVLLLIYVSFYVPSASFKEMVSDGNRVGGNLTPKAKTKMPKKCIRFQVLLLLCWKNFAKSLIKGFFCIFFYGFCVLSCVVACNMSMFLKGAVQCFLSGLDFY